jgi:hypothetical protein
VFDGLGGTLTGTFTTNDAITQVTAIDLTSSSNGKFQGYTYNDIATLDSQRIPNSFRLSISLPSGNTDQLQLTFLKPLTTAGGTLLSAFSFEHQDFQGSGNRVLSGTVSLATVAAAVPEPSAWMLMILGFGGAGVMLRNERRKRLLPA